MNGQAAESYGYDLLNHLVTQGGQTIATYDAAGNLQSRAAVLNYVYNFGANNNHQVTSAGGYSLTYDANGNVTTLIGNGADKTLTYQPFNLPSQISAEGKLLGYLYDGAHARIKETVQIGAAISSTYYLCRAHRAWPTSSAAWARRC